MLKGALLRDSFRRTSRVIVGSVSTSPIGRSLSSKTVENLTRKTFDPEFIHTYNSYERLN